MQFVGHTIDGQCIANWPKIQATAAKHNRCLIEVCGYSLARENSLAQMAWTNGVLIPYLAGKTGNSRFWWKTRLKLHCGQDLFVIEKYEVEGQQIHYISHENDLTIAQGNDWISNILEYLPKVGFVNKDGTDEIKAPNKNWRRECITK